MKPIFEHTDDDLRRAWRECKFRDTTFEAAMANPALAISVRRIADVNRRRQLRLEECQRNDRKRAQANDIFDRE